MDVWRLESTAFEIRDQGLQVLEVATRFANHYFLFSQVVQ